MSVHIAPVAIVAVLLPWSVYRRIRRNVGRQPLSPTRQRIRVGVMAALFAVIASSPLMDAEWEGLLAMLVGGLLGAGISVFALKHTKFETIDGAHYYVPNAYIGLALSAVLMARLGWRMVEMWPQISQGALPSASFGAAMSPLTLLMLGTVLGYYASYYFGILTHEDSPHVIEKNPGPAR